MKEPVSRLGRALVVIGWNEYVDLPDWDVYGLRAKMDTGARSSALHVENLQELAHNRVRFDVVTHRNRQRDRRVHVEAPVARRGRVRSSSGHMDQRIFVDAHVRIGPVEKKIEVSLVDREKMIFRMLLGRTALSGHLLIDVAHAGLLGRPTRRRRRPRATPD